MVAANRAGSGEYVCQFQAFGWRSEPAIQRIKQAVSEIRKTARRDPVLGAEGAVLLLELDALVPLIAEAAADAELREGWLDRLWAAIEADQIPYLDRLPDDWGDQCGSKPWQKPAEVVACFIGGDADDR